MNIAVNLVNIVNIENATAHPQPLPKGGESMRRDCYHKGCLVLSGMLFGIVGNAAFSMSQWVGLFVPTVGTICPNGWDSHWKYPSAQVATGGKNDKTSIFIESKFKTIEKYVK